MSDSPKIEPKKYPKGEIFLGLKLKDDYEAYDGGQTFDFLNKVFEAVDKNIEELVKEYPKQFNEFQIPSEQLIQIYKDVLEVNKEIFKDLELEKINKKYHSNQTLFYDNFVIANSALKKPETLVIDNNAIVSWAKNAITDAFNTLSFNYTKQQLLKLKDPKAKSKAELEQAIDFVTRNSTNNISDVSQDLIKTEKLRENFEKNFKGKKPFSPFSPIQKEEAELKIIRNERKIFETDINNYPICVRRFAKKSFNSKPSFKYIQSLDLHVIQGQGDLQDIVFFASVEYRDKYVNPSKPYGFDWDLLGQDLRRATNKLNTLSFNTPGYAGRLTEAEPDQTQVSTYPTKPIITEAGQTFETIGIFRENAVSETNKNLFLDPQKSQQLSDGFYLNTRSGDYGIYSCELPLQLPGYEPEFGDDLVKLYNDIFPKKQIKKLKGDNYLELAAFLSDASPQKYQISNLSSIIRTFNNSLIKSLPEETQKELNSYDVKFENGRTVYEFKYDAPQRIAYVVNQLEKDIDFRNKVFSSLKMPNSKYVDFEGLLWYKNNTPPEFFEKYINFKINIPTFPTINFITGPGFKESDRQSFTKEKQSFLPEVQKFFNNSNYETTLGNDWDLSFSKKQYTDQLKKLQDEQNKFKSLQTECYNKFDELKFEIYKNIFGSSAQIIADKIKVKNTKTINTPTNQLMGYGSIFLKTETTEQNLTQKDFEDIKRAAEFYREYYYYLVTVSHKYYNPLDKSLSVSERWKGGVFYEFALKYSQTLKDFGLYAQVLGFALEVLGIILSAETGGISSILIEYGGTIQALGRLSQIIGYGLETYTTIEDDKTQMFSATLSYIFSILIIKGQYLDKLPGSKAFNKAVAKKFHDLASKYSLTTIVKDRLEKAFVNGLLSKEGGFKRAILKANPYLNIWFLWNNQKMIQSIGYTAALTTATSISSAVEYNLYSKTLTPLIQNIVDNDFNNPELEFSLKFFSEILSLNETHQLYKEFLTESVNKNTYQNEIETAMGGLKIEKIHNQMEKLHKTYKFDLINNNASKEWDYDTFKRKFSYIYNLSNNK